MSAPVLEFCGLTKRLGGTLAADRIDLELRPGEILALLGENGAGKSTLIEMLAGVYAPDAGHLRQRGAANDPRKDAGSIASIHQDLGLIEWMAVAENIAIAQGFPRRPGLSDWAEVDRRARASLALVAEGIEPEHRVQDRTRTEGSRLAIARALGSRRHPPALVHRPPPGRRAGPCSTAFWLPLHGRGCERSDQAARGQPAGWVLATPMRPWDSAPRVFGGRADSQDRMDQRSRIG
jgi:predicted ABC-type transport system involved in lysophospholipase L1 biosynthesis ATPase subunit